MKKIVLTTFLLTIFYFVSATTQESDILYYKNQKLWLSTCWRFPSPLETYFSQNNMPNFTHSLSMSYSTDRKGKILAIFTTSKTSNYRGHIAVWEIENDKLYLKEVRVEDSAYPPEKFNIKSKTDTVFNENLLFADWFTGVIECTLIKYGEEGDDYRWKTEAIYYFHIRNGNIVNTQILTMEDFERMRKISENDTSDSDLMNKHSMYILNENYISYYYRLYKKDTITIENESGYLEGNNYLSPLLLYFSNDHTKFPYNWENLEKNGAPNCKWIIENEKIYLTEINLYSGLVFYEIDKDTVHLSSLFPDKVSDNKVFGDWISGIYKIEYGENVKDEDGYYEFKPTKHTYLRINNGIVTEMYSIPSDSDLKNIPNGLRQILDELNAEEEKILNLLLENSEKRNKKGKNSK